MKNTFNQELFNSMPVVGIMRNFPSQYLGPVVNEYQKAGFTTLEITMNSGNPTDVIRQLRDQWGDKMNIGAGTVCTKEDLERALEAGAQFIVTPITSKKVIKGCVKEGVPVFPGACTPTEIYKAWKWGATMVKVFPARLVGPAYIKDVIEPLDDVKLVPTGGVNKENFVDFLKAGAKGVGIATSLFPQDIISTERWDLLAEFYRDFVSKYQQYKNENK